MADDRKSKTDVINEVATATGESKASVSKVLDSAFEIVQKWVAENKQVAFLGFGTFKLSHRAAREGRNPQTGEKIKIAAVKLPKFTVGKAFKDEANK